MKHIHTLLIRCLASCLLAAGAASPRAADLPPVQQGLWRVKSLITFEPDPSPGAPGWPGLEGKPRARDYVICIDGSRARYPMWESPSAVRVDDLTLVERTSGAQGTFERTYRQLHDKRFEGGFSSVQPAFNATFFYSAELVSNDCGAVLPSGPSKFGEP